MPDITTAALIQNAQDDLAAIQKDNAAFKVMLDKAKQRIDALEADNAEDTTDADIVEFEKELDQTLVEAAMNIATDRE